MAEEPTIGVLAERINNVQATVNDVKRDMATKSDQEHATENLLALTTALERERTERIAAVKEVATRQQLVEDRQEARKYQFLIAIASAVIAPILVQFLSPLVQR